MVPPPIEQTQSTQMNMTQISSKTSDAKKLSCLYVNKRCAWPNCKFSKLNKDITYETLESYQKDHLNLMHRFNDHTQKDLLAQISKVTRLQLELQQNRALLNEMLTHLNNKLIQDQIIGFSFNHNEIYKANASSDFSNLSKSEASQSNGTINKDNSILGDEIDANASPSETQHLRDTKNRSGFVLNEGSFFLFFVTSVY